MTNFWPIRNQFYKWFVCGQNERLFNNMLFLASSNEYVQAKCKYKQHCLPFVYCAQNVLFHEHTVCVIYVVWHCPYHTHLQFYNCVLKFSKYAIDCAHIPGMSVVQYHVLCFAYVLLTNSVFSKPIFGHYWMYELL